jgi:hypothetical protein
MVTASFTSDGGVLSAEVVLSEARDGSYDLRLWHSGLNWKIKEWNGNFINTADDRYDLPEPAQANDGRLLQALVVIAVPSGVSPCTVSLVVRQDGRELAREERKVAPGSVDQITQLWVVLAAGGAA